MSFTEQLKKARKGTGLTQEQAAKALAIDKSTYCGYETGKRKPDVERIKELARLFNVKADVLLETSMEPKRFVTNEEYAIIEMYRDLDDWGRGSVDSVLAREHARCRQASALAQSYHLDTIAAHADPDATTEELDDALSKLLAAHPEFGD